VAVGLGVVVVAGVAVGLGVGVGVIVGVGVGVGGGSPNLICAGIWFTIGTRSGPIGGQATPAGHQPGWLE